MNKKIFLKKLSTMFMAITILLTSGSLTAFASSTTTDTSEVTAKIVGNSLQFTNFENVNVGEVMKFDILDDNGEPATVGIRRVSNPLQQSGTSWQVWYTGVTINAEFYMDVNNNKCTSVYDDWILVIGGTFKNDKLTKGTKYGKLAFTVDAMNGAASGKCWLKGTCSGSGNEIKVTWQM